MQMESRIINEYRYFTSLNITSPHEQIFLMIYDVIIHDFSPTDDGLQTAKPFRFKT